MILRREARPALLGIALAVALVMLASLSSAESPRVLLIGPLGDPVVARMQQELQLLGLVVEVAPPSGKGLSELAETRSAAAVARVEIDSETGQNHASHAIVLWVDPKRYATLISGATELRVTDTADASADPSLLALRAVELLRGRLVPVPETSSPDAGGDANDASSTAAIVTAPAPPDAGPPAPAASTTFNLFAGPAILLSPGGVSASIDALVGVGVRRARFDVEAFGWLPTSAGSTSANEGTVRVFWSAFGADAHVALTPADAPIEVVAGLGLGALLGSFRGEATSTTAAPNAGSRWMALPSLTLGARVPLRWGALRLDFKAGFARPAPVVRALDRDVATFGEPLFAILPALELRP